MCDLEIKIEQLTDYKTQDLEKCISKVKDAFILCEIQDEKQIVYIKQLISYEIREEINITPEDPKY